MATLNLIPSHASKPVTLALSDCSGSWTSYGPAQSSDALAAISPKRGNRRASKFKQSDLQRALAAVTKSGVNVVVEIAPDGTIRLVPATMPTEATPTGGRIVL